MRCGGARPVTAAELAPPRPTVHDLRHTHALWLIAAGWDVVEIAKRLGDRVEMVLSTYSHDFDARQRADERRSALEAIYGGGDGDQMATNRPSQGAAGEGKVLEFRPDRDTS